MATQQQKIQGSIQAFRAVIVILMIFSLPAASAEDRTSDSPRFSVNGFGTLGVTHSSENHGDFTGSYFQPKGAGFSRSWPATVDSKLGLQLDGRFSDRFKGVVQVVTQYNIDGTYTPDIEWANLAYQVTPDFSLRVGRTVTSTFLFSEVSLVGYANTWIRPPAELYFLLPVTNKDGIDASYQFQFGDLLDTLQVSFGRTTKKIRYGGEFKVDRYLDIHNSLEWGSTTFRLGFTSFDLDFEHPALDALFDGFADFGNLVPGPAGEQALSIVDRRHMRETPYQISTVGISHDPGNWLLMAEWARSTTKEPTLTPDFTAWHITGAYRLGDFTPYLIFARVRSEDLSPLEIPTEGLPLPLAQAAGALNYGLAVISDNSAVAQHSVSAGIRWDVMENVALKLQYNRVSTDSGTSGGFINLQPGFRSGNTAEVFSVVLDFVF